MAASRRPRLRRAAWRGSNGKAYAGQFFADLDQTVPRHTVACTPRDASVPYALAAHFHQTSRAVVAAADGGVRGCREKHRQRAGVVAIEKKSDEPADHPACRTLDG